jgi:deoxyribonuclease V
MILAVDVAYRKETALVGAVLFRDWADAIPLKEFVLSCKVPDNYRPGLFYRRELPCITALLEKISAKPDCIIVDGFVYLGRAKYPGLGKHLYDLLAQKVAVIGVAKTPYRDTPASCRVLRGSSKKPLYVTAAGIEEASAKSLIKNMHGRNRIPTLLKYVDRLCQAAVAAPQNINFTPDSSCL